MVVMLNVIVVVFRIIVVAPKIRVRAEANAKKEKIVVSV
jgi:hypothetical protein